MFGKKKESKQDMRTGMWEKGPAKRSDFGEDRPLLQRGPEIVSPRFQPQAKGYATHE